MRGKEQPTFTATKEIQPCFFVVITTFFLFLFLFQFKVINSLNDDDDDDDEQKKSITTFLIQNISPKFFFMIYENKLKSERNIFEKLCTSHILYVRFGSMNEEKKNY